MTPPLVAGVDSSTQSVKVSVYDLETGALVREARRAHPPGIDVDPEEWWAALQLGLDDVGGLSDVVALSVAAQQHGLIALDEDGRVVRPALVWNDTRAAAAAADLARELSSSVWAREVGVVPVASFTISKARWLAEHEPHHASRVAAFCLPHDWLMWRLRGSSDITELTTDRSDASGTGYFDPRSDEYRLDLLRRAFGREVHLPRVLGPRDAVSGPGDLVLGVGAGDNAAAHLGLGDAHATVVSLGTSGVVMRRASSMPLDETGAVAGFADLTGEYLPLVCTLNAARVLDHTARVLGVDHDELSRLALEAPPGARGLTLVPYFEGERTPNRPFATGSLAGLTLDSFTRDNLARAAVEGVLRGVAAGFDAFDALSIPVEHCVMVGGGTRSRAISTIAATVWGRRVDVVAPGEYVTRGAARQAAWAWSGLANPPEWPLVRESLHPSGPLDEASRRRYALAAQRVLERSETS